MIARLTTAYLERLAAPRGLGDLEPADLAGEAGSLSAGDGVRVTLRLDAARTRVAAAAFRAVGGAAPRAPGSILSERLPGLSLDAARDLAPEDLLGPLGPAPAPVARAADRLVEALRAALADGRAAARVSAPGILVCRCLSVGDRAVRRAIRAGARDPEAIGRDCRAGTGCHSCWPDLRALLDEEAHRGLPQGRTHGAPPLEAAIAALVRPLWRAQGVCLGRVEVAGPLVRLHVAGVETGASTSPLGALAIARHALREALDPDVRVAPLG